MKKLKQVMDSNKVPFNIFERSNIEFHDLHMVCDFVCSEHGVGSTAQHAQVKLYLLKNWEFAIPKCCRILCFTTLVYLGEE